MKVPNGYQTTLVIPPSIKSQILIIILKTKTNHQVTSITLHKLIMNLITILSYNLLNMLNFTACINIWNESMCLNFNEKKLS